MSDDTLARGALTWSLHDIQRRHSGATIRRMAWLLGRSVGRARSAGPDPTPRRRTTPLARSRQRVTMLARNRHAALGIKIQHCSTLEHPTPLIHPGESIVHHFHPLFPTLGDYFSSVNRIKHIFPWRNKGLKPEKQSATTWLFSIKNNVDRAISECKI